MKQQMMPWPRTKVAALQLVKVVHKSVAMTLRQVRAMELVVVVLVELAVVKLAVVELAVVKLAVVKVAVVELPTANLMTTKVSHLSGDCL